MKPTIVTEGELEKLLLQAILINGSEDEFRIIVAGGWSSADSLARSLLIRGEDNVAIVVDADTSDANLIEERRGFLRRSLGVVAPSSRFHVLVIAPEIEGLIFNERSAVEELVGHNISNEDFARGEFEPKQTLAKLLDNSSLLKAFKEKLLNVKLETIRARPEIRDLRAFLLGTKQRRPVTLAR